MQCVCIICLIARAPAWGQLSYLRQRAQTMMKRAMLGWTVSCVPHSWSHFHWMSWSEGGLCQKERKLIHGSDFFHGQPMEWGIWSSALSLHATFDSKGINSVWPRDLQCSCSACNLGLAPWTKIALSMFKGSKDTARLFDGDDQAGFTFDKW